MEESRIGNMQIMCWEQLVDKERNGQEELLLQSIYKLEPAYWSGVRMAEDCLYGAFSFHEGQNGENSVSRAAFLLGKQEFILVIIKDGGRLFWQEELLGQSEENSSEKAFDRKNSDMGKSGIESVAVKSSDRKYLSIEIPDMEEGLEQIFERILERGQQKVEKMERYLIDMEQEIVSGKISRNRNRNIFECKRSLTMWKNDYGRFLNVVEGINGLEQKKQEGHGQVLTEESACYFRVYEHKLKRLTEEIQFLYEELVHIREALDAALSYEQNRIMKVFTTVTTIFMPLSLIAGWYGMNFTGMPELRWKYGYAFVGALSILVILVCSWFFKRKKLF